MNWVIEVGIGWRPELQVELCLIHHAVTNQFTANPRMCKNGQTMVNALFFLSA